MGVALRADVRARQLAHEKGPPRHLGSRSLILEDVGASHDVRHRFEVGGNVRYTKMREHNVTF